MLVGLVSESHSLLILGWCSSLPRASDIWTLDSVPMFKFLFVIPSVLVLVPSFPPPSRFTSVLALQGIFTVSSLLLFFLPPLYPYPRIQPPPSSSVWSFIVRPLEVFNQSSEGRPKSSPGFLSNVPMQVCTPP